MLELKNISFGVEQDEGDKEIIRDISLTIPDDKLIVVTGPNGGGKSTLARLIAGIETPTSGRIYLDGEDLTDLSITERGAGNREQGTGNRNCRGNRALFNSSSLIPHS